MGLLDLFRRRQPVTQQSTVNYIMTPDGNRSIVIDGSTYQVSPAHPNHARIAGMLQNGQHDGLLELIDVPMAITKQIEGVTVDEHGSVYYNGDQIHNTIADRIFEFLNEGKDFRPLARFLSNLMDNPSEDSRNELYDFLEHGNMPITPDGCFMAYKSVRTDYTDHHTGTIDNSPGTQPPRMERDDVDDDRRKACSNGYHVGSFNYATRFGGYGSRLMLVKVNPADAVSVPYDHSCEKLRVSYYEVVEETKSPGPLEGATYEASFASDLVFDEKMNRWRNMSDGGRVVSATYAEHLGYSREKNPKKTLQNT